MDKDKERVNLQRQLSDAVARAEKSETLLAELIAEVFGVREGVTEHTAAEAIERVSDLVERVKEAEDMLSGPSSSRDLPQDGTSESAEAPLTEICTFSDLPKDRCSHCGGDGMSHEAVMAEKARIVAWLRGRAASTLRVHFSGVSPTFECQLIADAIERGEHEKENGP